MSAEELWRESQTLLERLAKTLEKAAELDPAGRERLATELYALAEQAAKMQTGKDLKRLDNRILRLVMDTPELKTQFYTSELEEQFPLDVRRTISEEDLDFIISESQALKHEAQLRNTVPDLEKTNQNLEKLPGQRSADVG